MMGKIEILGWLISTILLFTGCGSSVASGPDEGGTTLEVIACRGVVRDGQGNGVANVPLIARSVIMTGTGDSIVHTDSTISGVDGAYLFDSLPKGTYVISANGCSRGGQIISSGAAEADLVLQKVHTLYGKVFTETEDSSSRFRVEISGTDISFPIDSNGYYSLQGVPEGFQTLVITNGKLVNYLPIEIAETSDDTVFIRDVRMVIDTGKVVSFYEPFPAKAVRSFSVVPMFYKPGSEPSWYRKRDFGLVNYFVVTKTGTLQNYNPTIRQILHIGRLTADDELMINRLTVAGYTVVHHYSSAVAESDTTGCDLIFASSTVNLAEQKPLFVDAPMPIVTSSGEYAEKLGMISSPMTTKTVSLKLTGTDPVIDGLSGTVAIANQVITMEYGTLGSGAVRIGSDSLDSAVCPFYLYESGSAMIDKPAPARRIGLFTGKGSASQLNANGWKLFDQAILRALGR